MVGTCASPLVVLRLVEHSEGVPIVVAASGKPVVVVVEALPCVLRVAPVLEVALVELGGLL